MLRTAECVTPKHPDKICDRISDAILDACLEGDPNTRSAIETMGGHGIITVTGELSTREYVNVRRIAKEVVKNSNYGIMTNIVEQSQHIAGGISSGGAGDQGIMIGYACNENEAMIPDELFYARKLCMYLYNDCEFMFDGKTQITMDDGKISVVVASFQNIEKKMLEDKVRKWLSGIDNIVSDDVSVHANPAGNWIIGGFEADTGLTGRKIAVDCYGPRIPIGGGAFSGKDATKVDRSGAYAARKAAVEILESGKYDEVYVYLAYGIGMVYPVMAEARAIIRKDGADVLSKIETIKLDPCLFTPNRIIEKLELCRPKFKRTAEWGHMGRGFAWDDASDFLFT